MRPGPRSLGAVLLALAVGAGACGGDDEPGGEAKPPARAPDATTAKIDHPLVPLSTVPRKVFEGTERDPDTGDTVKTKVDTRVLEATTVIDGLRSAVVAVRDYEDGELVESTRDYYAERADGSVLYMGEHVNDLEGGKVIGHGGQWISGEKGARRGLFMPAKPRVGETFEQERAPGVAEDRSTILAVGREVTTPAGRFTDCIKTKDYAPLDKVTEFKYYCRGVGLVREDLEDGRVVLVSYRRG
jgi:hypothetical protein